MLKNCLQLLIVASYAACSLAYGDFQLKTERNAICGVETYRELRDPSCGAELYFEKRTSACEVERYNSARNGQVCGMSPGSPYCLQGALIENGDTFSCPGGKKPVYKSEPKTCENPAFGVAQYKACRHPSHDIERYATCRKPSFGVALYKSCSFYKTPEEIDAFIEATYGSLAINSVSLPSRQADLYGSFRQEASFICLIEKYSDLEGYDDVVLDLTTKFKNAFGYEHTESSRTCAESAAEAVPPRITAGTLDCGKYTIQTIKTLAKPDTMNTAVFTRFKSTCTAKLSYDFAVSWFDEKLVEINQLLADIVARQDSERKTQLESLRTSVTESK